MVEPRLQNKLKYRKHFSILSSKDKACKEVRDKSDNNNSENDNTEQGRKLKNNLNYSDKVNKRPRVVNLDPEEVQEDEKDLNEDVDKEKDTDDYKKNTNNNK
ncbi:hypothetical protein F8M41_010509 [Gigaspora margarita]|uniref:Uncharacterized protein n=1 Tax=Gigaspora margarita TaxID=4874 RepID=A0A8H3X2J5_GIGMA|nr:hypothetical protein F8M41_010509 [Gigaspora margarita]